MIKSTSRAVVLLGAAFLVGGAVGAAAMKMASETHGDNSRRGGRDCVVRNRMVCYWTDALKLSADQQTQLLDVYDTDEKEMDSIQQTIRPAVDSIFQTIRPAVDSQRSALREKVRPHLDEMQRAKYDSIVNAYDEHRRGGRPRNNKGSNASDRSSP